MKKQQDEVVVLLRSLDLALKPRNPAAVLVEIWPTLATELEMSKPGIWILITCKLDFGQKEQLE